MTQQENKADKPRKVRGTATIYDDNRITFQPQTEGVPQQRDVKKKGLSTFYHTSGEKDSSIVAHLKVPSDCEDPAARMFEELFHFTKDIIKKDPKMPQQRKLLDKEQVSVWHRRKEHEVAVLMKIRTDVDLELSNQLFNLTSEVNKCLAINKTSLMRQK